MQPLPDLPRHRIAENLPAIAIWISPLPCPGLPCKTSSRLPHRDKLTHSAGVTNFCRPTALPYGVEHVEVVRLEANCTSLFQLRQLNSLVGMTGFPAALCVQAQGC